MRVAKLASLLMAAVGSTFVISAAAKLPPLNDEAKAKAAETAAKAAWTDKVASFQLCNAMNKVAATYQAAMKQAGKTAATPVETPACTDPGPTPRRRRRRHRSKRQARIRPRRPRTRRRAA